MREYYRFIAVTLFFMGCVAYILVLSNPEESTSWSKEEKESWIDSCIGLGIGDKDLCNCVLKELESKYISIEDMYKDPQEMAVSMRLISAECKK